MITVEAVEAVLAELVPSIHAHRKRTGKVYVLAVSGLQGSGKTTWAAAIAERLNTDHGLATRAISLDDFYLDHDALSNFCQQNQENKLFRSRGQPGTHDEKLARDFFRNIMLIGSCPDSNSSMSWPAYDKSLHQGRGGRMPTDAWVTTPLAQPLDVLIFEGWCVGFQPISAEELGERWQRSFHFGPSTNPRSINTLQDHSLEHLILLNSNLQLYCDAFMGPWRFDSFVQLVTDDLARTYDWRLDQEANLIKSGRTGMSAEDVIRFVRGYMPAYELYLDRLTKQSIFADHSGAKQKKHIQLLLDSDRNVSSIKVM